MKLYLSKERDDEREYYSFAESVGATVVSNQYGPISDWINFGRFECDCEGWVEFLFDPETCAVFKKWDNYAYMRKLDEEWIAGTAMQLLYNRALPNHITIRPILLAHLEKELDLYRSEGIILSIDIANDCILKSNKLHPEDSFFFPALFDKVWVKIDGRWPKNS